MIQQTAAQKMINTMGAISEALAELKQSGLPRRIIVLALVEKTNLSEKTINAVLKAIEETAKELCSPIQEQGDLE